MTWKPKTQFLGKQDTLFLCDFNKSFTDPRFPTCTDSHAPEAGEAPKCSDGYTGRVDLPDGTSRDCGNQNVNQYPWFQQKCDPLKPPIGIDPVTGEWPSCCPPPALVCAAQAAVLLTALRAWSGADQTHAGEPLYPHSCFCHCENDCLDLGRERAMVANMSVCCAFDLHLEAGHPDKPGHNVAEVWSRSPGCVFEFGVSQYIQLGYVCITLTSMRLLGELLEAWAMRGILLEQGKAVGLFIRIGECSAPVRPSLCVHQGTQVKLDSGLRSLAQVCTRWRWDY